MKPVHRSIVCLALFLPACYLLSACGGGSNSTPTAHNLSSGGSNVVQIVVGPGPGDANNQTFNLPLVTVTVCEAGGSPCAQIQDVLVDTGSSGLRLMASAVSAAGLSLPATPDPNSPSSNTLHECLPFADGYSWGSVSSAVVKIGGETTSSAIPVQVIDDSAMPSPAAPTNSSGPTCAKGTSLNNIDAFDANGVLGVGTYNQDCGSGCVGSPNNAVYWTCVTASGTCSSTSLALNLQVANPVVSFPTDNNGVIVQLPSIPSTGAPTASGYLVFGIGTQSNNGLQGATVLTADASGNFTTVYGGQNLNYSFIDSGSNALFFNDTSLESTPCGASGGAAAFYCPTSTTSLSATNQGINGTQSPVSFEVANLKNINPANFAVSGAAGKAPSISGFGQYFDWGLPFFYNRTVFIAIEGMSAAGTAGPYYAY